MRVKEESKNSFHNLIWCLFSESHLSYVVTVSFYSSSLMWNGKKGFLPTHTHHPHCWQPCDEICSWEQGGDCRWGSTFSITQQWALRQVITCSRSFLAYKIVNVRQDLWGPFSPQIHGFLLDVNGESAGRSPFLRRFLAECFLWLRL